MTTKKHGRVLYLYGITKAPVGRAPRVVGVDGSAAVRAVPSAGVVCWVSDVDKAEFADNLAKNMENLDWLAEVSVRHQRVVAAIAEGRDILPARFGTVFRSQASLSADVEGRKAQLQRDLQRISGADEWGIKIFSLRTSPSVTATAKSGRDYLQAKAALLHAEPAKGVDAEVEQFVETLEGLAVEISPGGGAVSQGQRGLQWQGSLLVKRNDRKKLQQLIERFSQDWDGLRRIECTGPWPPYSFISPSPERRGA